MASTAAPLYALLRIRNRVKTKDAYFIQATENKFFFFFLLFFLIFFDFPFFDFFLFFGFFFFLFFFWIFSFFMIFFLFLFLFFYFFFLFLFLFLDFFHLDLLSIVGQSHCHLFIWTYSLSPVEFIFIFSSGLTLYRQFVGIRDSLKVLDFV